MDYLQPGFLCLDLGFPPSVNPPRRGETQKRGDFGPAKVVIWRTTPFQVAFIECGDDSKVHVPPSDVVWRHSMMWTGWISPMKLGLLGKNMGDFRTSMGISRKFGIWLNWFRKISLHQWIFHWFDWFRRWVWMGCHWFLKGSPDASGGTASSPVTWTERDGWVGSAVGWRDQQ